MLKNTEDSHPDFKFLQRALSDMKSVADQINEAIRAAENRERCLKIQEQLNEGNITKIKIVAPHRTFIAQGVLTKQCRKERKPRCFFLFNDILVYGFSTPTNFVVSGQMKLANITVSDIPDQVEQQLKNTIMIAGIGKSFHVFTDTQEEKIKWLTQFQDTIAALVRHKSTLRLSPEEDDDVGAAPVWTPDENVEACTICRARWSLINRRHHCRNCGSIICGDCSRRLMVVLAVSKKPVRVCDNCHGKEANIAETNGKSKKT